MDTHKVSTDVSYALDGHNNAPQHLGKFPSKKLAMQKLVRQLQSKFPGASLLFCYEAGPCGYWLYRLLTSMGHQCYVVAPSLIPKKSGDRVKTDRRDSLKLSQLLKTGDLHPIYVPAEEDEAIRDLSRAREAAMRDLNDARYRLKALLLRNHINYKGTANWSEKHLRWLAEIVLPHHAQQFVLQEMIFAIRERMERLERLDNELRCQVEQWRYYPVVRAIQAMRGVRLLVAVGVIAELGDLTRFGQRVPTGLPKKTYIEKRSSRSFPHSVLQSEQNGYDVLRHRFRSKPWATRHYRYRSHHSIRCGPTWTNSVTA